MLNFYIVFGATFAALFVAAWFRMRRERKAAEVRKDMNIGRAIPVEAPAPDPLSAARGRGHVIRGKLAYYEGASLSENPYHYGTFGHDHWKSGWLEASRTDPNR